MNNNFENNVVEATIAVVLTDIIGSTAFVQKNGSRVAAEWFHANDRIVISLLTKHNGFLCDASDGILSYFGNVQDAIAFSFAYKKQLRVKKFPFRTRIGIHWGNMLIVKTPENLVRANHKRISLEGIGKNIAARTMSLCGPEQILLSDSAYKTFKRFGNKNPHIPKEALSALVGLYRFKGVSEPAAIYAIGLITQQMQPPKDSEKAKRIGGAKKIKTRLKHKRWSEIFYYFLYRLSFISLVYITYIFWPLLTNPQLKHSWGIDYLIFYPFEYLDALICFIKDNIK